VRNLDVNPQLFKHKLFQRIYHDLSEDKLALPTLPEVLVRIQTVVEEQQFADELISVVASDPAISAVVLKIANSAVYRKGDLVDTVKDAVVLIGVEQLKDILLKNVTRNLHYSHSPEIIKRVQAEQPQDQFALTRIMVEERAKTASPRWRADCLSRRLSILERQPVSISMDGQQSRRSNPCSYLLRNSPVRSLENYLAG
jgi:hypothetical protein